jgi:excinuclease UvrABC nuclease subunit
MNSVDLSAAGFSEWYTFSRATEKSLLRHAPSSPGAYVLRRRQSYPRRIGASDITYIGSAANADGLRGRLRQYFHPGPTQSTNKRILELCGESDQYEVAFTISDSRARAKAVEANLLEHYVAEHGELPPENRRY